MGAIVEVKNLSKHYGSLAAVDGISFDIGKGEIFGLLGPNGAGKTTTVEIIEGLRKADGGSVFVCGMDALREPGRIKEIIGVQLQSTSMYDRIRVKEAIDLFGSYYRKAIPSPKILDLVSLNEKKNAYYISLSGGQKQRVAIALALVNDPEVLFLDEPTTGLDPQARRNVWEIIENLKKKGKTIILTTHYMEEAEKLCDRVGIIDRGKIIAADTPDNLISNAGLDSWVEFKASEEDFKVIASSLKGINKSLRDESGKYIVYTKNSSALLKDLVRFTGGNDISIDHISTRKASLEDVFLKMTGRKLRE
ncbi:MAG: ABC transporter ATP-binding protein [Candidatus Humimicrobiaceae bacterium]